MIRTENLGMRYGEVEALKGVTFSLPPGEILAILGPSGCGKTTLLRLLAGFETPSEGRVLIDSVEVSTSSCIETPHRRGLSMIFQDLALWPHMTVRGHLDFVLDSKKISQRNLSSKVARVLKDVNLMGYDDRYPRELSGGEKQRLAIARALVSEPKYLLMDEPFSNLDTLLREELQGLIVKLKDRLQMGVIYVSHHVEETLAVADSIAVMNAGEFEQLGHKGDVLRHPETEFVRRLLRIG
jgi:iron(III) transport system ATP-binding protein